MRLRVRAILALALALAAGGPLFAQSVPGAINFQGRLTDTSNNPLTGSHNFVFSIWSNSSGGSCPNPACLWTETQNGVSVANGVLAVQLGAASAIPPSVFYAGNVWLQINVDGSNLSPLQQLVAVPYALSAAMLAGKQYISSATTPSGPDNPGDLWYNTNTGVFSYYLPGTGFIPVATGTVSGLPANVAYTNQSNTFASSQTILGAGGLGVAYGIVAGSGTFTQVGGTQYSLETSSGI
ncbi:MAG: hypothetical protein ACYCPQ_06705, partial [Elusimicrobiota bacterium]